MLRLNNYRLSVSSNTENLLVTCFSIQTIIGLGWIAVYPYGGHIALLLWFVSLFCLRLKPLDFVLYLSLVIIISLYYLLPRTYGSGNTFWHLQLLIFSQMFFLNKDLFSKVFHKSISWVIILCWGSVMFRSLVYFGIGIPFIYVDLDPQFFNLYWPFYIDRLNFSTADIEMVLGSFRFQGPFWEPGALGIMLGVSLYGNLSRFQLISTIIFGCLSLSMAFFFIALIRVIELSVVKIKPQIIIIIVSLVTLGFFVLDQEGFIFKSTYGRFFGTNDKILNTRLSSAEIEQILLFSQTYTSNLLGLITGIGWDLPGSGGSYRQMVLGAGIIGLIGWFCFYYKLVAKLAFVNLNSVIFRTPVLMLLGYIWGNWMSPILVFLWYKKRKRIN